jgi:TPP-dependent pyruvate/acetoin dehydrogenase alpha subunit
MPANAVKSKLRKPVNAAARPRRRSKHSLGGLFVTALDITAEQASEILRRMVLIRHFEEQLARITARQMRTPAHEAECRFEAVAAAGYSVLEPHDYFVTSQCVHHFVLARSGEINQAAAEWVRETLAHDMPQAQADVISGNLAVAAGTALAAKLDKKQGVALSFMAPDETHTGVFHEAMSLISAWKLPVVIVVSDAFVPLAKGSSHRKPRIFTRAQNYNLEGVMCDATSVLDLRQTISTACQRVREGEGATLIEAALPLPAPARKSQSAPENEKPRGPRDPIVVFKSLLEEAHLLPAAEAETLDREAAAAVKEAIVAIKPILNETSARR